MQKIDCRGLSAAYGKKQVFQQVSLELVQGEFACLCGSNGSGKSTLLSVLAGLPSASLHVTSGTITPDTRALPRKKAARLIAYLQQNETCTWDFPVLDYVVQGRFSWGDGRGRLGVRPLAGAGGTYSTEDYTIAREALALLDATHLASRTVHTLSGGEFQKIRIARALTQTPQFLLLDEPAASLDFVYEPRLMSLLATLAHERHLGILASVHNVNLAAEYADKMIMLSSSMSSSAGSAISGTPAQLMTAENLEKIYGVPFICRKTSSFQSSL